MVGSVTTVAILAGGASRRMGEDKALLRLSPGSPALLQKAVATALRISSDVFVVSPVDRDYQRFGARIVADLFPGEGPLGGIITALEAARSDHVLILSCDHPFLSAPLLRWMSELPSHQLVLPEIRQDERALMFPIHARYRGDALPILLEGFSAAERRLKVAIQELETLRVGERDLRRFDPGLRSLINLNTAEEARRASEIIDDRPEFRHGSRQRSGGDDILNR
jgi:molybdopterin-guanine dinucleotide biosynthesis protein A